MNQKNNVSNDLKPGYVVRVHQRVKEGGKERNQVFEGVVIAIKHGNGPTATFTVRKMFGDLGVERIYPFLSPMINKIEVVKKGKVRRAKLYYLRNLKGKKAKLKGVNFRKSELNGEDLTEEQGSEAVEEKENINEAENVKIDNEEGVEKEEDSGDNNK